MNYVQPRAHILHTLNAREVICAILVPKYKSTFLNTRETQTRLYPVYQWLYTNINTRTQHTTHNKHTGAGHIATAFK